MPATTNYVTKTECKNQMKLNEGRFKSIWWLVGLLIMLVGWVGFTSLESTKTSAEVHTTTREHVAGSDQRDRAIDDKLESIQTSVSASVEAQIGLREHVAAAEEKSKAMDEKLGMIQTDISEAKASQVRIDQRLDELVKMGGD